MASAWANIYHDRSPHGDSIIEGDVRSLLALRDALTKALGGHSYGRAELYDSDGEGYVVHVVAGKEPCGDPARPQQVAGQHEHDAGAPDGLWDRVMRHRAGTRAAGEG